MHVRPALGRGLGSLISQAVPPPVATMPEVASVAPKADQERMAQIGFVEPRQEVLFIALERIRVNPRQPRRTFSPDSLDDLKRSIQEYGILQPLIVTRVERGFELIAGERRFRAARAAGLKEVPALIRQVSEQQKLELALIENIQRQDLNPYEEALAYQTLLEEFGLTQEELAKRVGKSRSAIANAIRLLDLPQVMLVALQNGEISRSQARTLLAEVDPVRREALFESMKSGEVSVREAEERLTKKRWPTTARFHSREWNAVVDRLRERLQTRVTLKEQDGKGKITIPFSSKEELQTILATLQGDIAAP